MECPITAIFLLAVLRLCQGLVLVGEDKRQGLIPFPRVGRTFDQWIQPTAYRPELDNVDDINLPEDVFTIRYTRGLFTPRLGRKKRSPAEEILDKTSTEANVHSGSLNSNVFDLGELLTGTPWAIIAYKDGVEKKMAFSPRLGRAMGPRLGRKRFDASEASDKRAAAFAPRLGRSYLAEDSTEDEIPYQVSVRAFGPRPGRSHDYTPPRVKTLTPRLGRSDSHISNTSSDSNDQQNV